MVCEVGELGIGHAGELGQIRIRHAVRYAYGIPLHHFHVLC